MKKLYAKLLAVVMLTVTASISFTAAGATVEGEITDNLSITLKRSNGANQPIYYITPAEDITLEVETNSYQILANNGANYETTFIYQGTLNNGNANIGTPIPLGYERNNGKGRSYFYDLKKGKTYFFNIHLYNDYFDGYPQQITFTFKIKEIEAPHITNITPSPGSGATYYPTLVWPDLQMEFNRWGEFTFGNSTLSYVNTDGTTGSTNLEYRVITEGRYVMWHVYDAIIRAKGQGMKGNASMTLTIPNPAIDGEALEDDYINAQGSIVLTYKYQALTSATSSTVPSPFLSYWAEDAQGGVAKFVFDGELLPLDSYASKGLASPDFSIHAGPYVDGATDSGEDAWPRLPGAPVTISGNTLTVDLRGVDRPAEGDIVAANILKETPEVGIWMRNVFDINGNPVDFRGNTLYQIYGIPYILVEKLTPASEIIPASTEDNPVSLADVNTIEVWVDESAFPVITITGFRFTLEGEDEPIATVPVEMCNPHEDYGMVYDVPVPAAVQEAVGKIFLAATTTSTDGFDYNDDITAWYVNPEKEVSNLLGNPDVNPRSGSSIYEYFPDFQLGWNYETIAKPGSVDASKIELYIDGTRNNVWYQKAPQGWGGSAKTANVQGTDSQGTDFEGDDGTGSVWDVATLIFNLGDSANFLIPDGSEIKIVIPEGLITTTDGKINPEVTLTYYRRQFAIPDATFDPAEGTVESLGTVKVSWDGYYVFQRTDNDSKVTLSFDGGAPEAIEAELGGDPFEYQAGYFEQLWIFVDRTEPGEYEITIPQDFVFLVNENSGSKELEGPITIKYEIEAGEDNSGIVIVGAEDDAVYYDLQGRRVVNPDRGIYIKVTGKNTVKVVK